MKSTKIVLTTLSMILAAALVAPAQNTPRPQPGSGPQQGQRKGPSNGKKIGPQDGSGPIHQPGTGGGTGSGQRRGRR
jgi:hypothetical protein